MCCFQGATDSEDGDSHSVEFAILSDSGGLHSGIDDIQSLAALQLEDGQLVCSWADEVDAASDAELSTIVGTAAAEDGLHSSGLDLVERASLDDDAACMSADAGEDEARRSTPEVSAEEPSRHEESTVANGLEPEPVSSSTEPGGAESHGAAAACGAESGAADDVDHICQGLNPT